MYENLEKQILQRLRTEEMDDFQYVYYLTVLAALFPKTEYLELVLEAITTEGLYTVEQRKFLLHQINVYRFQNPLIGSERIDELECKLYESIVYEMKADLCLSKRKKAERNAQNVVVLTDYFLGERHAPTHSTLERCYTLKRECGMNVSIISYAENILRGQVPYYDMKAPNVVGEYDGHHEYIYRDESFRLFQPIQNHESKKRLQELISYVEEINPYYIVYVGNRSYVADILNEICPVVTVATIFSKLPGSNTTFSMVGRAVTALEKSKCKAEIIEVPFTFELTEKTRNYTREELGIPENTFVMAIVGNRLNADVTDEFLEYMEKIEGGFFVYLGEFQGYEEKKKKYPYLQEKSISLGRVNDVLGILECMDLYVNPKRRGGGFSVMEAFKAGIPAVTIAFGDVAAAAGTEFCVENYEEMLDVIEKYIEDKVFYQEKCELAKLRVEKMTNGAREFKEGIEKMLVSTKFE